MVPASVLADVIGQTQHRVRQLSREGVLPKAARGQWPFVASLKAYIQWLRQRAESTAPESDVAALQRAQARRMTALAQIAERKAALQAGEQLPREDFEDALNAVIGLLRSRLIALPGQAAPLVCPEDPRPAEAVLRRFIVELLEEISATRVEEAAPPPAADAPGGARGGGRR